MDTILRLHSIFVLCSQEPANEPSLEPDDSRPYPHIPNFPKWSLCIRFSEKNFSRIFLLRSLIKCTMIMLSCSNEEVFWLILTSN
jgi:hypothetical protein